MEFRCPSCGAAIPQLPFPLLTVDAILEVDAGSVVLVRRRFEPLGWALPGGFVQCGESLEDACRREVLEETGLEIEALEQMHAYSDPGRDPRRPTVTVVFVARARGTPRGGDDAAEAAAFPLNDIPQPLCFDHGRILEDYRLRLRRLGAAPGRPTPGPANGSDASARKT